VNIDAPWSLDEARQRVLGIQTKLHQWATDEGDRRFSDLYNLVCDPAFLVVAWSRVKGNRGARTAGVDGVTPRDLASDERRFLAELRAELKAGDFRPLPVRERRIPKPSGKLRTLGIPTAADRTVQAALKLVLEPIFEADFKPCSYGFRPNRRAQDAIAEVHHFAKSGYRWAVEGDIEACFDSIDHPALMDRIRDRIGDKRVLWLIKAFLHAGVLSEDGHTRHASTGTPQGGTPLTAVGQHCIVGVGRPCRRFLGGTSSHLQPTEETSPARTAELSADPICGRFHPDGLREQRRRHRTPRSDR